VTDDDLTPPGGRPLIYSTTALSLLDLAEQLRIASVNLHEVASRWDLPDAKVDAELRSALRMKLLEILRLCLSVRTTLILGPPG
jgi:hypothetical protein